MFRLLGFSISEHIEKHQPEQDEHSTKVKELFLQKKGCFIPKKRYKNQAVVI